MISLQLNSMNLALRCQLKEIHVGDDSKLDQLSLLNLSLIIYRTGTYISMEIYLCFILKALQLLLLLFNCSLNMTLSTVVHILLNNSLLYCRCSEHFWAYLRPFARITKEQTLAHCLDTLSMACLHYILKKENAMDIYQILILFIIFLESENVL